MRMCITRLKHRSANYFLFRWRMAAHLFLPICIDNMPTIELFTPDPVFAAQKKIVMRINARIAPPIMYDNGGEGDETESPFKTP